MVIYIYHFLLFKRRFQRNKKMISNINKLQLMAAQDFYHKMPGKIPRWKDNGRESLDFTLRPAPFEHRVQGILE